MYLIEVKNRAKAIKNLNQPPKFYPLVGMESILRGHKASSSLIGATFFGDDADIMGLKLADVPHWYAGPFDEGSVTVIAERLATMERFITDQKNLYDRLGDDLGSDIQGIVTIIGQHLVQAASGDYSSRYLKHLVKIGGLVAKIGMRPSISSDPILHSMADQVAALITPKIATP